MQYQAKRVKYKLNHFLCGKDNVFDSFTSLTEVIHELADEEALRLCQRELMMHFDKITKEMFDSVEEYES